MYSDALVKTCLTGMSSREETKRLPRKMPRPLPRHRESRVICRQLSLCSRCSPTVNNYNTDYIVILLARHRHPQRRRRRRRRFYIDTEVRCVGAHPPFGPLSRSVNEYQLRLGRQRSYGSFRLRMKVWVCR